MMESIYRCANCGQLIRKPDAKCTFCGYRRGTDAKTAFHHGVYLVSLGPNPAATMSVLSRYTGKTPSDIRKLLEQLPARVFSSDDEEHLQRIVALLEEAGAQVQIAEESPASSETEPTTGLQDSHPEEKPERKKRLSWLIPFLAMIPVLINVAPGLKEKIPVFINKIIREYVEQQLGSFEQVFVVVASRNLEKGTALSLTDLKPALIPRNAVPESAVAPLDVDLLIGRMPLDDLLENQIILLESMTDHE